MKLRRIRIEHFRKFTGGVEIGGLGDGLTVIAGDNEEGKSTLLAAVQSVFFNRHRLGGEAAQAMQPFGSTLRPHIAVDFELHGRCYALRKAFCQSPEAELVTPTGTIRGDAVEDALQDLLRFEPPGRGAARVEHRGIWGLFWIEQGTSFTPLPISGTSREAIVAALEGEVGQVLGGERGRALVAAIQERYDSVLTGKGKPKGDHKKALEAVETLEREFGEVRSQLADYDDKVERLAGVQARLRRYADERTIEAAATRLKEAEAAAATLNALEAAVASAEQEHKFADLARDKAAERWRSREALIDQAAEVAKQRADVEQKAADAAATAAASEARVEAANEDLTAVTKAFTAAEAAAAAAEQRLTRVRLEQEFATLTTRLVRARQARDQAEVLRREAAAIRIDDKTLEALRHLQLQANTARIRLETVATRLEFAPEGKCRIIMDGEPVAAEAPLRLTRPATLTLEGFGRVTVTPGGEDLGRLTTAAAEAERAVARALAQAGSDSLADAAAALGRKSALLMELGQSEARVAAHAPEGIEALTRHHDGLAAQLAALPADLEGSALLLPEADAAAKEAKDRWDVAKGPRDQAADALKRAETAHRADREAWIAAQAALNGACDQETNLETKLARDREALADEDLRRQLVEADDRRQTARAVAEARSKDLEQAQPEAVRLESEIAREALQHLRDGLEALRLKESELRGALEERGRRGLGEKVQELEGDLARARAQAGRFDRDARALKLLLDTLTTAERQARESFFDPVRQRVRPYLKLLFPDSELVLGDDNFADLSLRRAGVDEPFESLSVGTREQLAVLTRLAFADFLREKGQPAPLILDDALVYADDDRFRRMQLVLRKAADHLQVIILTCRERDYETLGAPIIRLADCRVAAD